MDYPPKPTQEVGTIKRFALTPQEIGEYYKKGELPPDVLSRLDNEILDFERGPVQHKGVPNLFSVFKELQPDGTWRIISDPKKEENTTQVDQEGTGSKGVKKEAKVIDIGPMARKVATAAAFAGATLLAPSGLEAQTDPFEGLFDKTNLTSEDFGQKKEAKITPPPHQTSPAGFYYDYAPDSTKVINHKDMLGKKDVPYYAERNSADLGVNPPFVIPPGADISKYHRFKIKDRYIADKDGIYWYWNAAQNGTLYLVRLTGDEYILVDDQGNEFFEVCSNRGFQAFKDSGKAPTPPPTPGVQQPTVEQQRYFKYKIVRKTLQIKLQHGIKELGGGWYEVSPYLLKGYGTILSDGEWYLNAEGVQANRELNQRFRALPQGTIWRLKSGYATENVANLSLEQYQLIPKDNFNMTERSMSEVYTDGPLGSFDPNY